MLYVQPARCNRFVIEQSGIHGPIRFRRCSVGYGLPSDSNLRPGHHRKRTALPGVVDQLEKVLAELGLDGEPISVRMMPEWLCQAIPE